MWIIIESNLLEKLIFLKQIFIKYLPYAKCFIGIMLFDPIKVSVI